MGEWIVQNWLALLGTASGVLAIPVSVLTARTWGNRRRKLSFQYSTTPMLGTFNQRGSLRESLEVRHEGTVIPDPHVISLTITNIGPVDVTSQFFDRSEPLRVRVGLGGFVAFIRTAMPNGQAVQTSQRYDTPEADLKNGLFSTSVEFPPQLLRRGESWSVEILFSGTPKVEIINSLADTDISTSVLVDLPGSRVEVPSRPALLDLIKRR